MKVLIIEDDPEIAALERDYLHIHGYCVSLAATGAQGLALLRGEPFDLVILDIMLPGMDGFAVLKEARGFTDIPVLLVSARGEDIDKIRGLGLGADDYIQKPFSPGELVARVGAHLARYRRLTEKGGKRREITVRGLRVDIDDRRVFAPDGAEISLTAKEFDVLSFLIENPNRVWSKEDLFERVWGLEALGDSGTVVVHIKKIREKIELDPAAPQYIETVWGAGYRFRV
ncbi:MAG: response regulator transcription factor [Oscillospiraceae bacterium]|jgi:DNA-binding response OmpR family regulator|nr:response regulator transcription factor [Oscillospiraceae bacterium]